MQLRFFTGLLLATIFLPFAAIAEQISGEFIFLLKGRGNVFWKVIRQGIEETAKERGVSAVVLNTDDDQTPEAQLNMCFTSIARKPRVIVLGAATKNVGIECFKKAAAAGVIVADIDGNVSVEDAKSGGVDISFSVASDNTLIGQSAAEHLKAIAGKEDPRILIIRGLPGSIVSEKRATGFSQRLKELLPKAVIVASPTADWDRMKAMNTALDSMQREANLDYIFSVSDVMTTGVVEAVKVAKRETSVQILSVDGIADARKAILDGRMAADVAQLPYLMGKRSVELAIDSVTKGGLNGVTEFTPTPVLTKLVLEMNVDPMPRSWYRMWFADWDTHQSYESA